MEDRIVMVGEPEWATCDRDWALSVASKYLATFDISGPFRVLSARKYKKAGGEDHYEVVAQGGDLVYHLSLSRSGRLCSLSRSDFPGGTVENPSDVGALERVERWLAALAPPFPTRPTGLRPGETRVFHFGAIVNGFPFVYTPLGSPGYVFIIHNGELVQFGAHETLPAVVLATATITEDQAAEEVQKFHKRVLVPQAAESGMTMAPQRTCTSFTLGWALQQGASEAALAWRVESHAITMRSGSQSLGLHTLCIDANTGALIDTGLTA